MLGSFLQRIVLLSNYLAAFLLALGFVSRYISPNELSYVSVIGLTFPYFVIINIFYVFYWLVFKRKYLRLSLSMVIFVFGFFIFQKIDAKHNSNRAFDSNKASFTILSYNVRVFDLYNWSNNKKTRDKIFNFVRSETPEIACFQEFYNNSNGVYYPVHDSLMKNQTFNYSHVYYTDIIRDSQFGIATYSNYPIINKHAYTFKNTNNLFISSDIVIGVDTVRLINCHLESIRLQQSDYNLMDSISTVSETRRATGIKEILGRFKIAYGKRAKQSERITSLIKKSPYPVICCGDFNDTPNSYAYHTIKESLFDSFYAKGGLVGFTYNRFFPPFRIDYLLFSKNIHCSEFTTLDISLSDHKPIIGRYSISSK